MRIATRHSLLLCALALVVEAVSLGPFYLWVRGQLHEEQDSRIQYWVERLASRCGAGAGAFFEAGCLAELRHGSGFIEPFVEVVLLDADGQALYHSDLARLPSASVSEKKLPYAAAVARAAVSPVSAGAFRVYWADFGPAEGKRARWAAVFDQGKLDASLAWLQSGVRANAIQFGLLGASLGILLSVALARHLIGPLQALLNGIEKVATGDFTHRVPEDREDELGVVSRQFNAMAGKLNELDELKEKFLQSITHDLRSPLSAILGYGELMLEGMGGTLSETHAHYMNVVCRNAHRLGGYISDILDVAKMEAGGMQFDKKPILLDEVAQGVVELLLATALELKIKLHVKVEGGPFRVMADPDMLSRVFTNLVSNAMKFTPKEGTVTVSLSRRDETIVASVRDTGTGIPEDQCAKVFDKFYQVQETKGAARKAGTGLGLTITKEIVEGHGGRIWVESGLGRGADFKFTLPALSAERMPA